MRCSGPAIYFTRRPVETNAGRFIRVASDMHVALALAGRIERLGRESPLFCTQSQLRKLSLASVALHASDGRRERA